MSILDEPGEVGGLKWGGAGWLGAAQEAELLPLPVQPSRDHGFQVEGVQGGGQKWEL